MPVAFDSLMVLSRELTPNSCQLIQNISLLPPPMRSRISCYQHVTIVMLHPKGEWNRTKVISAMLKVEGIYWRTTKPGK